MNGSRAGTQRDCKKRYRRQNDQFLLHVEEGFERVFDKGIGWKKRCAKLDCQRE
jgi:hypothetical protein